MPKIKLTKHELKRQRDSLDQFLHYLPTLQLKKQQLQIRIFQINSELEAKQQALDDVERDVAIWTGLLADPGIDIKPWIVPKAVDLQIQNIAGADIPVLGSVSFAILDYDLYAMPLWVDEAIARIRNFCSLLIEVRIFKEQIAILHKELLITTQRVNLFEKVKIPECVENIRSIRIYLGDQQANAVGVGKVAKRKIEKAVLAEVLV
jgi:V/A-type H+-transporting ATPase subunit D